MTYLIIAIIIIIISVYAYHIINVSSFHNNNIDIEPELRY